MFVGLGTLLAWQDLEWADGLADAGPWADTVPRYLGWPGKWGWVPLRLEAQQEEQQPDERLIVMEHLNRRVPDQQDSGHKVQQ
jgi:hypothetical protein